MVLNLQKEIKKRTVTYGTTAVLLAVLLTAVIYNFGGQPNIQPAVSQLKTFSSYEELKNFLKTNMEQAKGFQEQYLSPFLRGAEALTNLDVKAAPEHSTTNIQAAGVDEADIVKTGDDGHLYVVSGGKIYILKAYPPEQATVLSTIILNETYNTQIYTGGNKLAVLGNLQVAYAYPEAVGFAPYVYNDQSFIKVYDITNKTNPILTRTIILNGTMFGSRMIGDYVYGVVNQLATQPSNQTDIKVALPKLVVNGVVKEVQPNEIHYLNIPDVYYYFTTIVAVNVLNDAQEPTKESFLTGATASMYVSQSNMYLTVPNTSMWIRTMAAPEAEEPKEETLVYRVKLDKEKIVVEDQGKVPGYVLNQFSMDEYNGFFRIATTEWTINSSQNNLYVLNMSLSVVGKLEGLAPGERIYSARFMGERCYLVTFEQKDPFFAIDLSNPAEPKVLGKLIIQGFSGYLHPYDENNIIGVGREDNNVKLSLFNVANATNPQEVDKFVVQGGYSDSAVLADHKAFLFDKSKRLLALPVSINWIEVIGDAYYTKGFWQGAYVFDISLSNRFVLKGNVTHQENSTEQWDSGYWVKRVLYIDNVLYTVSDKKIKMNSLEDLREIKEIRLP